jgi:hypothetical protein
MELFASTFVGFLGCVIDRRAADANGCGVLRFDPKGHSNIMAGHLKGALTIMGTAHNHAASHNSPFCELHRLVNIMLRRWKIPYAWLYWSDIRWRLEEGVGLNLPLGWCSVLGFSTKANCPDNGGIAPWPWIPLFQPRLSNLGLSGSFSR